jgi:erythromycin esterase-like protein
LLELRSKIDDYVAVGGLRGEEAAFFAQQNALLVRNAEEYYRSMFRGGAHTWNLRDSHMFQTLKALDAHITRRKGRPARIAVWAHNSHVGDARATEMSRHGELNLGQLAREEWKDDVCIVGFTTYAGKVLAADDWGGAGRVRDVTPALRDSYEAVLHGVGGDFALRLADPRMRDVLLRGRLLERAVGVIYRPGTERVSHYLEAKLPEQFDWVVHIDETTAVRPIVPEAIKLDEDLPETYPTGV